MLQSLYSTLPLGWVNASQALPVKAYAPALVAKAVTTVTKPAYWPAGVTDVVTLVPICEKQKKNRRRLSFGEHGLGFNVVNVVFFFATHKQQYKVHK